MMDQFGNGHKNRYKNQYKEETSQIHAPAALLERTRLAVAEEEKRLQAENIRDEQNGAGRIRQESQQNLTTETADRIINEITDEIPDTDAGIQNVTGSKDHHQNHGRGYRWAFSVAAAAVLLLAVHGFVMLRGVGAGKAFTDWGADMTAAGSSEEDGSMNGSAERAAGGMEGEAGSNAVEESGGIEYAEASVEDYADLQSAPAKTEDSASVSRESAGSSSKDQIKELEKKYSEEDSASRISLTEVDRKPDFCDRPDTKRVISQGITFYVTESVTTDADGSVDVTGAEKGGWSAYAEYNGAKYVVTGEADDQEDFLEKAYDILTETAGGRSNYSK